MSRLGPVLGLGLGLGLACVSGCSVTASAGGAAGSGTVSPGTGSTGKPAHVEPGGAADGGAVGDAGGGATPGAGSGGPATTLAAAAPCQPALADAPTALFGTRIVIRLPKGLELVERNPFYAQAATASQTASCGQPIHYAAVGFVEYPASSSVTAVRDQLLELRGLPAASLTWSDEGSRGRTYTGAYAAPTDAQTGAPAVNGWFVLRESNDKYGYFALYETDPTSWEALKSTFIASGRSFFVKPRAPAPAGTVAAPEPAKTPAPATTGGISAQPANAKAK